MKWFKKKNLEIELAVLKATRELELNAQRFEIESKICEVPEDADRPSLNFRFIALAANQSARHAEMLIRAIEVIENWIQWEREQIKKDGPYAGDKINSLIKSGEEFLNSLSTSGGVG